MFPTTKRKRESAEKTPATDVPFTGACNCGRVKKGVFAKRAIFLYRAQADHRRDCAFLYYRKKIFFTFFNWTKTHSLACGKEGEGVAAPCPTTLAFKKGHGVA